MRKAIFPGSFDPFTIGHQAIVNRALALVDEVTIAIGYNHKKKTYFTLEQRIAFIRQIYQDEPKIQIKAYDTLTVDFAKTIDAQFIVRGVRTVGDFEYEKHIADINKQLSGIDTFILFADPEYAHISSDLVRELMYYNKDISDFIPTAIHLLIKNKQ